jgi:hypothetical protein
MIFTAALVVLGIILLMALAMWGFIWYFFLRQEL